MNSKELLERIVCDPQIMIGKPVIKGTRLTVEYILNLMAGGATIDEILEEYEELTKEDIRSCLLFSAKSLASTTFMPLGKAA